MVYSGWEEEYRKLVEDLRKTLGPAAERDITFELISHRFTARAKKRILEVFPSTTLPMDESIRKFKFGQFGYGKYVYPGETMDKMDALFRSGLAEAFPGARIEYLV
jgi:spore photoproduct lyase